MMDWRESIRQNYIIRERGQISYKKQPYRKNGTLFQNSIVEDAITELRNKYVLVLVDRATANVTTVCRLYALTLIKNQNLDWTDIPKGQYYHL